jgi:hypothetical protein
MTDSERWHPMGCGPLDSMMTAGALDMTAAGTALALLRSEYTRPGRRHRPELHDVLTRCTAICDRAGITDAAALPVWSR